MFPMDKIFEYYINWFEFGDQTRFKAFEFASTNEKFFYIASIVFSW